MDFLLVGSGIVYKEFFLCVLGVTRSSKRLSNDSPVKIHSGFIWRTALALGFAEAASTWTSLALQIVFYRLYFADWYIWGVVTIQSFGYMVIGVILAQRLARLVHRISAPSL
jgi:hypothetical protein